jgi:hypothetical protein
VLYACSIGVSITNENRNERQITVGKKAWTIDSVDIPQPANSAVAIRDFPSHWRAVERRESISELFTFADLTRESVADSEGL